MSGKVSGVTAMEAVPTFYPKLRDLNNFCDYVDNLARKVKSACKLVAPKKEQGWIPRKDGYDTPELRSLKLSVPIEQRAVRQGTGGVFEVFNVESKGMTLEEYRREAEVISSECRHLDVAMKRERGEVPEEDVERDFWRQVGTSRPAIYGADQGGMTFFDDESPFKFSDMKGDLLRCLPVVPGVNTTYTYVGMWRTCFAWHKEDMDLPSVNYLHSGAPKTWYIIHPKDNEKFEELLKIEFADQYGACSQFARHKSILVSPKVLRASNIEVTRVTQHPGEFMVLFPACYHSGFNHGFNMAEAINFGIRSWFPRGISASVCQCSRAQSSVSISVRSVVMGNFEKDEVDEIMEDAEQRAYKEGWLSRQGRRASLDNKRALDSSAFSSEDAPMRSGGPSPNAASSSSSSSSSSAAFGLRGGGPPEKKQRSQQQTNTSSKNVYDAEIVFSSDDEDLSDRDAPPPSIRKPSMSSIRGSLPSSLLSRASPHASASAAAAAAVPRSSKPFPPAPPVMVPRGVSEASRGMREEADNVELPDEPPEPPLFPPTGDQLGPPGTAQRPLLIDVDVINIDD
uniref:JmjC domain-containing protein n=1 Tax=Chromera velia CCMP2878 TaxID=1169474 RepID=A0A0G4I8W9_9ALVE|eukprot:Cvel_12004.t1-p1 / transcript=Cvel_12004.t1 / gene=Cvel_12004 / organism=Chromera_velia_CCMP2878 / gene_product=Probable lysine-specific demethylase 4A, putative / transcript_product=Probable lysine-specific demethylase 4A, putative / location=Cvel_scaffold770:38791-44730(+) / protein_length=567 / sequence_SO=supercontig / SO=protein_coding / is_pseudo=false